jgi:hypothetical protein
MRYVALVGTLGVALSAGSASACPVMHPHDLVVTPKGAKVYETGGAIVLTAASFGSGASERLAIAGTVLTKATYIGPGLSVFPVPTGTTTLDVQDDAGKVSRHLDVGPAPDPLPAPSIKVVTSSANRRSGAVPPTPGIPETTTQITLAAAAPADAYALIIYDGTTKDPQPRAFQNADPAKLTYSIYTGGKGCNGAGVSPTYRGDTLRFRWLDRGGRLSALSKPVRVGK